ncbi:hypothetical protein B5C34_11445 [Pacificimonas flava]|uniref:DUF1467 domain-containing protein n=2 Tax=Pacificimonas TaxID=1960290 RepID=A0A219B790_9SPHN|nr:MULTISPECIES: DUF1467 family protein [Pacificimonas]MBZ6378718.1 DUF1467 family protein [Pacificimonas aurantium]OWV34013.1 hypothetical protein B5C34_11445 [Pacificimonas flava]
MGLGSALAIYLLIWTVTLFLVLPFGVRTAEEEGEDQIPGQADSAPVRPLIFKKLLWNTLLSAAIFALLYANFHFGWVDIERLGFF